MLAFWPAVQADPLQESTRSGLNAHWSLYVDITLHQLAKMISIERSAIAIVV